MFHKIMKEIVPLGFIVVGILAMLKGDMEVWAICGAAGWYFHLNNMKGE